MGNQENKVVPARPHPQPWVMQPSSAPQPFHRAKMDEHPGKCLTTKFPTHKMHSWSDNNAS